MRRIIMIIVMVVLVIGAPGPCRAGASDWPIGAGADEYVTAFFNVTYYDAATRRLNTDRSEVGKYAAGRVGDAAGVVVHVRSGKDGTSHHGCEYPFDNDLPVNEPWIALVKRGRCNFDLKVENAYRSNASGVVVYDKSDGDTLEKMGVKHRNISAVFTYKWKGEEMASLSDNGTRVMLYITVGSHCTRPYSNINNARFLARTSVLFVSISFVVLMIILLAWLVFYYIQRFRYLHAKDRLARRLCSAAKKAISKIPTKHMKPGDKEVQGEGECCAVCIEPYRPGDVVRALPCKHQFHKVCVDPWLLEHRTCPMCKMDILKYYGFVYTGSQESILQIDFEDDRHDGRESDSLQPRGGNTPPGPALGEISMMVLYPRVNASTITSPTVSQQGSPVHVATSTTPEPTESLHEEDAGPSLECSECDVVTPTRDASTSAPVVAVSTESPQVSKSASTESPRPSTILVSSDDVEVQVEDDDSSPC